MTKKEIIERLFTANLITFEEMWVLLQDEVQTPVLVPYYPSLPYHPTIPYYPTYPNPWFGTTGVPSNPSFTCKVSNGTS